MLAWSHVDGSGVDVHRVFTRPLGMIESVFYWDSVFGGTSDTLQQVTVETMFSGIFSPRNVERTWVTLKNVHPLLGASVREHADESSLHFLVDEAMLSALGPDEIMFKSLQSDGEVCDLVDRVLNELRTLSNERLAQVWIISLPRNDSEPLIRHQVLFHLAHSIADGMAQNSVIKTFFDILVNMDDTELYVPKQSLEDRLALHPAMEDLYPSRKYSSARQRWRLAIAKVMQAKREAALSGGHTLPRTITPQTFQTPAVSRTLRISLSKDVTTRILASCRKADITFGNALPVLIQLAHSRVLHRLRAQGLISDENWAHRITQPIHEAGPLNLRPYLDPGWLKSGGADRVCVAISFFGNTLPSMPVSHCLSSGKPTFQELLSKARFFYRCRDTKSQTNNLMRNPLLVELTNVLRPARLAKNRATALSWRARLRAVEGMQNSVGFDSFLPDATGRDFVMANGCSSMGNMDNMIPPEYPMRRVQSFHDLSRPNGDLKSGASSTPSLRITSIRHYLRCRPTELYLTSISYLQKMQLVVFCDVRTYDEALVNEWLIQVGEAAEWYLGGVDGGVVENHMARL